MAVKTLLQVLETHDQIVQGFQKYKKTLSRTRPTGNELVVKQKRKLLAALDDRLANAKTARDDALQRHDAGIARIELSRKRLSDEIAADEEKLGGGNDGGGGGGTRPTRPTQPTDPVITTPTRPTRPTVTTPVVRVRGVGKEFEKRLKQKNISSAGDLAAMDPAEVADVLSISESRAKDIVREAKKTK